MLPLGIPGLYYGAGVFGKLETIGMLFCAARRRCLLVGRDVIYEYQRACLTDSVPDVLYSREDCVECLERLYVPAQSRCRCFGERRGVSR